MVADLEIREGSLAPGHLSELDEIVRGLLDLALDPATGERGQRGAADAFGRLTVIVEHYRR